MNYWLTRYWNRYNPTSSDLSKSCKIRCQEHNLRVSLAETFGKSIQICTCQQFLDTGNTCAWHIYPSTVLTQHTPLQPFCLPECEARSRMRWVELIIWNVFIPHKRNERKRPLNEKRCQEILLTCSPLYQLPPSPIPCLVSKSLEFQPKCKEIVSCRYQGSAGCFLPRSLSLQKQLHPTPFGHLKPTHSIYSSKAISPLISR